MAYNQRNLYERMMDVQKIVQEARKEQDDIYLKEIYWQQIHPKYRICYKTFHTYLYTNAKAKLDALNQKEQQQTKLF